MEVEFFKGAEKKLPLPLGSRAHRDRLWTRRDKRLEGLGNKSSGSDSAPPQDDLGEPKRFPGRFLSGTARLTLSSGVSRLHLTLSASADYCCRFDGETGV